MRLYNIYYMCKSSLPVIGSIERIEVRNVNNNAHTGYKIKNWGAAKVVLAELKKIKCLEVNIEALCNTLNFVAIDQIEPEVTVDSGRKFALALDDLYVTLQTIVDLYESLELEQNRCGIDVKIPKCSSLKEYMEYLKEIEFVFTQCPYLLMDGEEIKFNNVDVGSQWLSFLVVTAGTFGILNNLARLVDKAVAIKSHIITLKQQEKLLDSMRLKNEATEEAIDVFKKMKRITMEEYVADVEAELGELKDGEERGKVEKTLEKLVILLDKGVGIYSSIETPNEVKQLFPINEDNLILPDNIVKLLEKKDE